jgi:WD40 repeat protein
MGLAESHLDQSVQTLSGHPGMVNSVSFGLDAERIASGGDDNNVKIWDAKSGQLIRTMYGHQKEVESVCFSPDGKRIVSGSLDTQIILWDADSGLEVRTLRDTKMKFSRFASARTAGGLPQEALIKQ